MKVVIGNNAIDVFANLPKHEISLPTNVKETLVYIAGYLIRKDLQVEGTFDYTEEMSRRGLAIP